jgi:serine/threonine protein kinase
MHGIMLGPLRIILEFCGDGDLQGVLKRRKVKGKALKTRLASDIAKAMEFLHSLDPPLAHRDLRSSNVLLVSCTATSKEAVAKVKLAESGVTKASAASLSSNWQWMAPEAMFGQTPPETCDLYSYAMILWEIWTGTGETPFETMISQNPGQKPEDFMRSIAQSNLRPVINSTWDVAELLVFLWDKNVHARPSFATCVELISDIQAGKVEDLGEKLRRDKAARAAAASVASIAPASSSDGAPSIFAEADDNPLRRLSRMTVAPGRGMTNAMAPQMMPCKFGANCQIMDCRFDHSKARSETAIAEALVDEIFATGDSFEPPPSMLPVVIPALQAPATRGSGGFKSGWEEEILQKAAAAKRAVEAQAKAAVDVEPTISTFGPGWEEEILKRAAARKAAEEERAKAAEAPAKATFVKARPSRAASDAREHNNSSPREAEEGSSGGLKGFLRGNRSRANSQDVSPRASPRASPRDEAGVSPQPSPRVVAAASAAPTTKAPSAPPGRVKSMGMEKPLPMPPGGLGQSPRAPTVAAPPAPIPGDDSGETRGRNRSSVVRMQPLSGSGDPPRKISPRVSAAAREETSPSAPREVRKPLPMPSRPAGCEVKRDSLRALPAALKRGSGAPSTVAPVPKAKPVAEAAEQWE